MKYSLSHMESYTGILRKIKGKESDSQWMCYSLTLQLHVNHIYKNDIALRAVLPFTQALKFLNDL